MNDVDWTAELRKLVQVDDGSGCWIYQGYIDHTGNGYGKWRGPGWDIGGWAHRNAWFIAHGPIPLHLEVDHLCYRPACVNVAHLELVTPRENMRRAAERRESFRAAAPVEHGTSRSYARGCECQRCVDARPGKLFDRGSRVLAAVVDLPVADESSADLPFNGEPWMADAACASSPVDLWTKEGIQNRGAQLNAAREVCESCPVIGKCIDFAIAVQPDVGVWGGIHWSQLPPALEASA